MIIVVGVVMVLIYSCLDRDLIFAKDPLYTKQMSNSKEVYKMQQWENFGYVDYIPYADFMIELLNNGEIDQETYDIAIKIGKNEDAASEEAAQYIQQFKETYEAKGYQFQRLEAKMKLGTKKYQTGGEPRVFVYRDVPLWQRLVNYLADLFYVDNIHYVQEDIGERGLTFTLYDPAYGGE